MWTEPNVRPPGTKGEWRGNEGRNVERRRGKGRGEERMYTKT